VAFDITVWWHWLFIAAATPGSSYSAGRVFFADFDHSHHPLFTSVYQFWYELACSMAGWMTLWHVLPRLLVCDGGACAFRLPPVPVLIFLAALIAVSGRLPRVINRALDAAGEIAARFAGR
jgi:hypothetical protein